MVTSSLSLILAHCVFLQKFLFLMFYTYHHLNSIYCPSANSPILSTVLLFFSDFCVFQDLSTTKLIGTGEVRDGLYHYKPFSTSVLHSQRIPDPTLWHQQLGHPFISTISTTFNISKSHLPCDVCARAKYTRLPFFLNTNKSTFCFNRIYCDIWGGYPIASHSGAHYFFTIVDDYSYTTWVYLMRLKSETYLPYNFLCNG